MTGSDDVTHAALPLPSPSRQSVPASSDDARVFLQERLAYLGRVYATIGLSFYAAGNLAGFVAAPHDVAPRLIDPITWIEPAACLAYLVQWLLCRRRPLSSRTLRSIDALVTTAAGVCHSLMVFTKVPGELPGLSYSRMLLLVTFGLLVRAIMVPSSPRRTLLLGLLAAASPVVTSSIWYGSQAGAVLPPLLQAVWTALWCLGGVVIATLASHVIFGLRQEVREARQLGQYTLLDKIGEGGMGSVYRATHAMLRRPTAVKLLPPTHGSAEHLERFEREVQLTSQLTHPNTVAVFDYGRTPDGIFYYAMEYLDGLDLEDLVRVDGAQFPGRVAHILRQIAASLAEAHGIGLIHRDIKPANVIMMAERGGAVDVAKVVDFGLAKELDQESTLSRESRIAGTPHYLAPEAITSPDSVGPPADLYAIGCVGYCLLTGRHVFDGGTVIEVCSQHLYTPPVPPAERLGQAVSPELSTLLMDCLEKVPERRPASALKFIERLNACHDLAPWTDDMARAWWTTTAPRVRAEARRHHRPAGSTTSPGSVTSLSYLRPKVPSKLR